MELQKQIVDIPGTFWFGRFDGLEKMDQIEEMTESSAATSGTDGQCTIDEGTEKPSFRKGRCIAIAMASIDDEDMGHFNSQKSAKIKRVGYDGGVWLVLLLILIMSCTETNRTEPLPRESYVIDSVGLPDGLDGEVGALAFLPSGKLIAAFRRGEIMSYDPKTEDWSMFANGLHLPMGILVRSESEILVMQYPELTKLKDTDGDGQADVYESVADGFGLGGNYHEFAYGPVEDEEGNLYFSLNSTSNGGVMMDEVRGEINEWGRTEKGMYSAVPYRGWVMKLTPDGVMHPYASGFRSPDGLGFDGQGHLLVTDNQGDWKGTSPLYQVEEGKFYGHPSSLIWREGWDKGPPKDLGVKVLDSMRQEGAVLFPQDIVANSPTQPVLDNTHGGFGPFEGQMFVGEIKMGGVNRVILEEVKGQLQGACVPFIDSPELNKGVHRLAFGPDGSLWVGQNSSGWRGGSSGIQRIRFTGKNPVELRTIHLTKNGFELAFTQPMKKEYLIEPSNYEIESYYYEYHAKYGSDQFDLHNIPIKNISVSDEGQKISLELEGLQAGRICQIRMKNFQSVSGDTLSHNLICYTVNHLR